EIGAGTGSLTRVLAPRVGTVIAIEKDRQLAAECGVRNAECGIDNATIVQGDALKVSWHALLDAHTDTPHSALRIPPFKVVGNIPYNITSPLLEKALTPPLAERIVFLVEAFRAFVAACFSRRRKQLRNVIMAATGRPAAAVLAGLEALGLDPAARPETLAPVVFARLWRWNATFILSA